MADTLKEKKLYTAYLQKCSAHLDDMRMLVRCWDSSSPVDEQKERIIQQNLLAKDTKSRVHDIFRCAFIPRFVKGSPPEAWKIAQCLEDRGAAIEILKPLYYWITARSEFLLYQYVTEELMLQSRQYETVITLNETSRWIQEKLVQSGQKWSENVVYRVASGLLSSLRDFGILEGKVQKRIASQYIPIETFSFIVYILSSLGISGQNLLHHVDWKLFLMDVPVVERLLLEAHQYGFLSFSAAGKISRVDFKVRNMEEMADAITGRAS